jgi:transketolase
MTTPTFSLEETCINTIRCISADQPQSANSGHPGAPMGCAPLAHLLWSEFMHYSSKDPNWINRDRFVLSNGHACALQYSMLHLTGYNLSIQDLSEFRQLGSKTPGHPESMDEGMYVN